MLLGAGFMMIEIAFFQKLTLFIGSPAMSLATILGSILVGMDLGSLSARKFYPEDNEKKLVIFCFILGVPFPTGISLLKETGRRMPSCGCTELMEQCQFWAQLWPLHSPSYSVSQPPLYWERYLTLQ